MQISRLTKDLCLYEREGFRRFTLCPDNVNTVFQTVLPLHSITVGLRNAPTYGYGNLVFQTTQRTEEKDTMVKVVVNLINKKNV